MSGFLFGFGEKIKNFFSFSLEKDGRDLFLEEEKKKNEEYGRMIANFETEKIETDKKVKEFHENLNYIKGYFFNKESSSYSIYRDGKFENSNKINETKIIEFKGVPHCLKDGLNNK